MTHRFTRISTSGPGGLLFLFVFSSLLAISLAGCGSNGSGTPAAAAPTTPTVLEDADPATVALMTEWWLTSGHADTEAEAFNHWNDDGAVQIPCARCHSSGGYQDWVGADGTAQFSLESEAPLGTTVDCDACHNEATLTLDTVIFPSGVQLTGLGAEARCMQCHQGRESTKSLNTHIAAAEVADDDTADPDLRFRNIHYFAAGATLYGGIARGAYQYMTPGDDMMIDTEDDEGIYGFYDRRNPHVAAADVCIECHNPHTLERNIASLCSNCHIAVTTDEDLHNIRMKGSVRDYDGDGNATEGIYFEIKTLQEILYAAMQDYATTILGTTIVYDAHSYPYYFHANGDRFAGWSARLLRAAYNYQYAQKDPGAYAHNPKYTIEFLYDSIADLNTMVPVPNFAALHRNDSGHFDAGAEAFRHWDDDPDPNGEIMGGVVSGACVRCHSPGGFDFWAEYGLDLPNPTPVGDGFRCEQCHVENADFKGDPLRKYIPEVVFASGVVLTNPSTPGPDQDDTYLCISCHRGRESGSTIDADIAARIAAGKSPRFRNIHYLAAGATLWGSDGEMGYQYPGQVYEDKWTHAGEIGLSAETSQCAFCHLEDHTFLPQKREACEICHGTMGTLEEIRVNRDSDYDGDGDNTELLKDEMAGLAAILWQTAVDYEVNVLGGTLAQLPGYPYYSATTWDAKLVRAMHNYQFWAKEPGAWAHNTNYIAQLMYDSIVDLGGSVVGLEVPGRP